MTLKQIQEEINKAHEHGSVGTLSDTYHSFNDLYNHREVLTAALLNRLPFTFKSREHEDGSMFEGMFIVGCATPYGMITYHYDNEYWNDFKVPVLPHAPHFDGHTPEDVIDRLRKYCCSGKKPLTEEESDNMKNSIQLIIDTFGKNDFLINQYIGLFTN